MEMFMEIIVIASIFAALFLAWVMSRRRVVSTDVVHIIQRRSHTVSYGVGCKKNVYYEWPSWMPLIGITVRKLPITNFDLSIDAFPAYDKDRIPFLVDIKAFFRVTDTNVAASRVQSYEMLKEHLLGIVQGTVRSILAKSKLEEIMEERSVYGNQFTESVKDNLKEWGIETVRNIELMDVRDAKESSVIENIMAKQKSAIEKESRVVVAQNKKDAEQAEITARREVEVSKADAEKLTGEAAAVSKQAVGIAEAGAAREIGIAQQKAEQKVKEELKITTEKTMAVEQVNQVKLAEIKKEAAIVKAEQDRRQLEISAEAAKKQVEITADAEKYKIENIAQANLESEKNRAAGIKAVGENEAEVIKAKGLSQAEAEKAQQLASVTAQTTLADAVGSNQGYQNYLIKIKEVEASIEIGIKQAEAYGGALGKADLKIIANAGDVQSGINKITDFLTTKGGQAFNGLAESLQQTEAGRNLLSGLLNKLDNAKPDNTKPDSK
jgi:flotillin